VGPSRSVHCKKLIPVVCSMHIQQNHDSVKRNVFVEENSVRTIAGVGKCLF
jgi:hypothetical protein